MKQFRMTVLRNGVRQVIKGNAEYSLYCQTMKCIIKNAAKYLDSDVNVYERMDVLDELLQSEWKHIYTISGGSARRISDGAIVPVNSLTTGRRRR